MIPGETIANGADPTCPDCAEHHVLKVLRSAAGFYIGTQCCGMPYSRESNYYESKETAQKDLDSEAFER